MKTVLITGANSYIGTSFEEYVKERYGDELAVDTIDMVDGSWRQRNFTDSKGKPYDCVFHVAGIAHADVGRVDEATKAKYYAVNTDLAIETAAKARECGCKQFVLMSSMIIYGKQTHIDKHTKPHPGNFYGDSKWKADKGVRKLKDGSFTVTVLRPPMIYGKGSKGNYPTLSKLAKKTPVFPDYKNKRSILYIENLCEFIAQVIIGTRGGVFWPQNRDQVSTSRLVGEIAKAAGHRVMLVKFLNPAVEMAKLCSVRKVKELGRKAFGDSWYESSMSVYRDLDYQVVGFEESIRRTEA